LLEVGDAGGQRRGADLADASDPCGLACSLVGTNMRADLLVAPAQVFVELAPVLKGALNHQARQRGCPDFCV
jgi:hypothetical protein